MMGYAAWPTVGSLLRPVCAGCGQWPVWPAAPGPWRERIRGGTAGLTASLRHSRRCAIQIDSLLLYLTLSVGWMHAVNRRPALRLQLGPNHPQWVTPTVDFKLSVLVFNCLNNLAPSYLSTMCQPVADNVGGRRLRSAARGDLAVPQEQSATVLAASL